ncbi:MAG: PepSY-associated TM helix domain-containing protein [Acidobacteriota bacterium]
MKRHGPFQLSRQSVRLFYDIHSWAGILGGLAFFVCAYSGTLALFEQELIAWERPAVRPVANGPEKTVDELFAIAQGRLGTDDDMFVALPTPFTGGLQARTFGDDGVTRIFVDPYTGEVDDDPYGSAFAFLTHLHTDLHLPRPFGRYLVGLLGIFMLMSLISGVMAHPKVFKELFLLRWRPKLRLSFSDLHKQVGVWGLAFGMVMAFTGAVIGLLGLIAPIMVLSAFGGDVGKATEAFSGPHYDRTGVEAEMLPVSELIAAAEERAPGFAVSSLFVEHWGDETAEVSLNMERTPHDKLAAGETHRLSLVDGRTLHVSTFTDRGIGSRLFGAMQPVHYALFGGMGLKLLYFISGMVLSFGIASGAVIWLEKRRTATADGQTRRDRYFWLGRAHLGICLGLVLGSVIAICAGRFAPEVIEPTFWLSWLAVAIAACFVPSGFTLLRTGGFATAVLLAAVAVGDLVTSQRGTAETRSVDIAMLALAALLAAAVAKFPRERAAVKRRDPGTSADPIPGRV